MVSFRRSILALAVLALFVGLASAQVGIPGTAPLGTPLACTATVAVTPALRSEGVTELIGDIVLTCTGGFAPAAGSAVGTANITVSLPTNVTSRILASGGVSEALLLIDEPGSGLPGPGPMQPQTVCSSPLAGTGVGGCGPVFFNPAFGFPVTTVGGTTPAPNVYQGLVSANQVTFNGIPILAPVTEGLSRVFRITNVRVNCAGLGNLGLNGTTPLNAFIGISGSTSLPINNPVVPAGSCQPGLSSTVRNASGGSSLTGASPAPLSLLQCNSLNTGSSGLASPGASAILRFSENFATAFKTRVAPTPSTNGLASNVLQNIPGMIYNSESGFIIPAANGQTTQPGLADFGTRLRAVFSNIPAGVSVFVTTTNVTGGNANGATFGGNAGPGSFNLTPSNTTIAFMVQSETAPDFNNQAPVVNPTNTLSGGIALFQVPLTAGSGEAVWEVVAANPNVSETFDFGVYFQYTANPGGGSPALGSGRVNLSFAPAQGPPGSTPSSSYTSASTGPIPRFVDNSTAITLITISVCSTDLLFPFVTNENGFETGMSIANTTTDPFGTPPQNGSCVIQFYGDTVPHQDGTTTAPCTTAGACTGNITSGTVFANTLSNIITGSSPFQGYAIAVCNFQLAHGFAFISDTHATNLAMGYLALVIGQPGLRSTVTTTAETLEN